MQTVSVAGLCADGTGTITVSPKLKVVIIDGYKYPQTLHRSYLVPIALSEVPAQESLRNCTSRQWQKSQCLGRITTSTVRVELSSIKTGAMRSVIRK
jgi:hypothetical protein